MINFRHSKIALFLVVCCFQRVESQPKPELILTGCLQPFDIKVKSGDTWLGFYATDSGYEMMRTTITVVDSACEEDTIYVKVNRPGEPIFLVRGISSLTEGSVRTAYYGRTEITPGNDLRLSLKDEYELMSVNETKPDGNRIHRITLQLGEIYQPIAEISNMDMENTPFLLWAGDLDRDGKLDLFYYLSDGSRFNGEFTLFLSSQAEKGKLVKKVASFSVQGD